MTLHHAPIADGPLVIGKRYKVPCVFGEWSPGGYRKPRWWPTLGPKHEDGEHIGFHAPHYHLDPRFLPPRLYEYETQFSKGSLEITGRPLHERDPTKPNLPSVNEGGLDAAVMRWRIYHRPWPIEDFLAAARKTWLSALEDAYACKRLKGMICPHRGADLTSMPAVDGVVTCPLHGLRWRVEDGEMVRG